MTPEKRVQSGEAFRAFCSLGLSATPLPWPENHGEQAKQSCQKNQQAEGPGDGEWN